jgi:lauroyl/myristoyl acyltransferase
MLLARRGTCAFSLIVGKPLNAAQGGDKTLQMTDLLRQLAAIMDRFIHAVPSQWMAFHDLDANDTTQRSGVV